MPTAGGTHTAVGGAAGGAARASGRGGGERGLIPCHARRRSPESNGLAEAFFGSFKRDYVYQACLETFEEVARQLPAWIEHYNREAPHSALGMQSPAEFYAGCIVKNKKQPVPN